MIGYEYINELFKENNIIDCHYKIKIYYDYIEFRIYKFINNIHNIIPNYQIYSINQLIHIFNSHFINNKFTNMMNESIMNNSQMFDFNKKYIICDNMIIIRYSDKKYWISIFSNIFNKQLIPPKNDQDKYTKFLLDFMNNYKLPFFILNVIKQDNDFNYFNMKIEQNKYIDKWKKNSYEYKLIVGTNNYIFYETNNYLQKYDYIDQIDLFILYPNKMLLLKNYLPNTLQDKYKTVNNTKIDDYYMKYSYKFVNTYKILNNYDNIYYKTDNLLNLYGHYIIYINVINRLNLIINKPGDALQVSKISLNYFNCNDLLYLNLDLGNNNICDKNDLFYFSTDIIQFYKRKLKENNAVIFYNYNLENITEDLINKTIDIHILFKTIILKKNNNHKYKCIMFYTDYMCHALSLYMNTFEEIYMICSKFDNSLYNMIKNKFNTDILLCFDND